MIYVYDDNGDIEVLTQASGAERVRTLNEEYSLNFVTFDTPENHKAFQLIENEAVIGLMDSDEEYRILNVQKLMIGKTAAKQVTTRHVFFQIAHDYQEQTLTGTINATQALNHIFSVTDWTWINQGAFASKELENWGDDYALALFQDWLNKVGGEFKIDFPNKRVIIKNQIMNETDAQFRYNHNLKSIKENIDTTNVCTFIKGEGAPGITSSYTSPLANNPKFGIRQQKTVRDERFKYSNTLYDHLVETLNDEPDVTLEAEVIELKKNGLNLNEFELGDSVFMIHEKLDIDVQIRAMSIKDYPLDKTKSPVVTLTNFKNSLERKSFASIAANFAQTQKQVKDIMDDDGNLSLMLKRLYMNTDTYADNTGVWYIDPTDNNRFVHIGSGGLDIHKGLMRVEREDGYASIVGGKLQYDFSVIGMTPQYKADTVIQAGRACYTENTTATDFQAYRFRHQSRYLRVNVAMYTGGTGTAYMSVERSYPEFEGWQRYAMVSTTNTDPSSEDGSAEMLIDLGVPTGEVRLIYLRLWASPGARAYGREVGIWKEG